MPQRIPMPDCLSFFLMVGNETAELAAHIASSARDHCGEPEILSINCISLVDESFDEETVIEKDLYYKCQEPIKEHLQETVVWIVREKIQQTMEQAVGKTNFHFQLNKILFVIVADAAGKYKLEDLDKMREILISEMEADGKRASALLCITADNTNAMTQRKWLLTEENQLRHELDHFEKVMILTPHNMKGFSTISTARDMQDVAFPALIILMNGHQINDPTRLYTAGYRKQGGTSNDIQELRRHIAADSLEGYFANPDAISKNDVLEVLSTDKIRRDGEGTTLLEKAMNSAERFTPQLQHLVLTADLESEDFNPILHILEFDELNRARMCALDNWQEEWLEEVKKKVLQQIHLDAIYHQLDENNPNGMVTEILRTWSDLMAKVTGENVQRSEYLETRMAGGQLSVKKGLLTKRRDHNLILLNAAIGIYMEVCKERIAYRMMTCLQKGLEPLRSFLKEAISRRQVSLKPYLMDDSKLRILKEMCPSAAKELEESYTRPKTIEMLPTFIQHKSKLYSDDGHIYWSGLYQEFLNRGTRTSSFSDAFMMNAVPAMVQRKVEPLGEDVPAMIPNYPDELGALPGPIKSFLLNNSVAEVLPDVVQDSQVFRVPGDILEHVSLFPISRNLDPLAKLPMFRKVAGYYFERTDARPQAVRVGKKPESVQPKNTESSKLNAWNIQIMESPKGNGMMLCWDYPPDHCDTTIRFNGQVIKDGYAFTDYIKNGKGLLLEEGILPAGNLQISIDCGEEHQEYETVINLPGERISIQFNGPKAKGNNGIEVTHGVAYDDRYDHRCLVFTDDQQRWRIPFYVDENGAINPLWCFDTYVELELEDL